MVILDEDMAFMALTMSGCAPLATLPKNGGAEQDGLFRLRC
jgi:hypothetical protein